MPLAPTTPVAQPAQTNFAILSANIQLEPGLVVVVSYAPCDAQGNQAGPMTTIQLGAAALTTMQNTAGGFRAKLYAALQTQVPALVGVVS